MGKQLAIVSPNTARGLSGANTIIYILNTVMVPSGAEVATLPQLGLLEDG